MYPTEIIVTAEKVVTILGILAGGIWAYFHYFRGRIYNPRLELNATAGVAQRGHLNFLLITLSVKNPGLSWVKIRQRGSGIRIEGMQIAERGLQDDIVWERFSTRSILKHHEWVESRERIVEQDIFCTKKQVVAWRLTVRVVSAKGTAWTVQSIVFADGQAARTADVEGGTRGRSEEDG